MKKIRCLIVAGLIGVFVGACSNPIETSEQNNASGATDALDPSTEASPEFIACFKSEALKSSVPVIRALATSDGQNIEHQAPELSEDESLALAIFLMSLDTICSGV